DRLPLRSVVFAEEKELAAIAREVLVGHFTRNLGIAAKRDPAAILGVQRVSARTAGSTRFFETVI
ncbi:MAG: hypothetical protein AAFN07_07980, partial [Pseudomonadota bacterium]